MRTDVTVRTEAARSVGLAPPNESCHHGRQAAPIRGGGRNQDRCPVNGRLSTRAEALHGRFSAGFFGLLALLDGDRKRPASTAIHKRIERTQALQPSSCGHDLRRPWRVPVSRALLRSSRQVFGRELLWRTDYKAPRTDWREPLLECGHEDSTGEEVDHRDGLLPDVVDVVRKPSLGSVPTRRA